MLPRWHIFWGIAFCVVFKLISPDTSYTYLFLIWFASVFIDFDHYLTAAFKHGKWDPSEAITHGYSLRSKYIEQKSEFGMCEKGDFHFFHTVEAHLIVGILGIFFYPLFFIFIGMILHSLLDLIWLVNNDVLDSREFFFINKFRALII
jgi:hypothetical protein